MSSIIIVNQSTGHLAVDVCNAFAKKYDKVTLLTGNISHFVRTLDTSINVVQICKYNKSSILKRLFTWIKGTSQIRRYLSYIQSNEDILFFTNPPMSYLSADKLCNKYGIVEYDIYPDALKNVKCPKFIFNWWTNRNKLIFEKAVGIITLSEGMKQQLTQYCSPEKIKVIPNWAAEVEAKVVAEEDNKFIKLHHLQGKFVVMYSGNIGYTHNVESIVPVAEAFKDKDNVKFIIIGQGGKKASLIETAKQKKLDNIIFSNYLPSEDIKYSMSSANLGIVTLTKETARVSVPSKTYNLLSYGIPLLNISPANSELGKIVTETKCGESFEPNNIKGIIDYINRCISDKEMYMGYRANARKASLLFTYANAEKYPEIFRNCL